MLALEQAIRLNFHWIIIFVSFLWLNLFLELINESNIDINLMKKVKLNTGYF